MPSEATKERTDELARRAIEALAPRIEAFQEAVSAAEREVREDVVRRIGAESFKSEQALVELGSFAVGRIDPERFSRLLGVGDAALTPDAIDVLDRADAILAGLLVGGPGAHLLHVETDGDLRDTVKRALTVLGSAYGAARAAELARAGVFDSSEHEALLGGLPYRLWNRAERRIAPPLIVEVGGHDCLPVGLGEFLDGNLVLVLIATGPTTPAPLSRLITPGTFVMQTTDPAELDRLAESDHPGIALVFDEDRPEQAYFVHDPEAGDTPWERLTVTRMPSEADVGRGPRAPRWVEELTHLRALAREPAGVAASIGGGTVGTGGGPDTAPQAAPADRLAAWLLSRTETDEAREGP